MALEIRDAKFKGQGLFTTDVIPRGMTILRFDGTQIQRNDIPDFSGKDAANLLQIGATLYLDLKRLPAYFGNHSCKPNCCVIISVNKAFLSALMPIAPGDELTYDYSTTSTEATDTWLMNCNCSLFGCRKIITGAKSIPEEQRKRYLDAKMFPDYVLDYLNS